MGKIAVVSLFVIALTGCVYMPTHYQIDLYVIDEGGLPLSGIACQLMKNGVIVESAVSDGLGLCVFEPIRGMDEAYLSADVFEKQFTIFVDGGTLYESKVIAALFDTSPGGSSLNGGPFTVSLNLK